MADANVSLPKRPGNTPRDYVSDLKESWAVLDTRERWAGRPDPATGWVMGEIADTLGLDGAPVVIVLPWPQRVELKSRIMDKIRQKLDGQAAAAVEEVLASELYTTPGSCWQLEPHGARARP